MGTKLKFDPIRKIYTNIQFVCLPDDERLKKIEKVHRGNITDYYWAGYALITVGNNMVIIWQR